MVAPQYRTGFVPVVDSDVVARLRKKFVYLFSFLRPLSIVRGVLTEISLRALGGAVPLRSATPAQLRAARSFRPKLGKLGKLRTYRHRWSECEKLGRILQPDVLVGAPGFERGPCAQSQACSSLKTRQWNSPRQEVCQMGAGWNSCVPQMGIEPTSEHWENFRYKFGTIQERRNKRSFP
jgi:hypothetical protein